jgi:4-hydroxy-3-methylbut-2-en-1-yl diphosphate reductase
MKEHSHFGVISQTTQPIEKVRALVSFIQKRFPNSAVRFIDTVCQPTKQRQTAAVELAKKCDVVVVIGGSNSNNTRELVATCRQFCERVYHVQIANDVRCEWLENVNVLGITAGTSTPDSVIDGVELRIQQMVKERSLATAA